MKKLTIFIFLLASTLVFSQKEAAIWYFGENAGLDFNSGTPVALTDGALNTMEGCSTISDPDGNLLFYSDGSTVWNRNHQIMLNGTGLLGSDDSTQTAMIVPKPQDPNIYYIFTVDFESGSNGMNYSEVDITLDGGLGAITALKNINLLPSSTEKVTAVKNANGEDIWVLGHTVDTNEFKAFSITTAGVNLTPVTSPSIFSITRINHRAGAMKINPQGNIGVIAYTGFFGAGFVFDFDTTTGVVSNMVQVSDSWYLYGVEFSPSGKILYLSETESFVEIQNMYQYNLEAADIAASETIIGNGAYIGYTLQLAIDGKIYGLVSGTPFLFSIENPNVLGVGCNFIYNSVDLNGRIGMAGLPPFIQSFFRIDDITAENTCLGDTTAFTLNDTVDSVVWDFGEPISGANNTSTALTPNHVYATAGNYTVTVTATVGVEIATKSLELTIYENPIANPIATINMCTSALKYELDLSSKNSEILGLQNAGIFSVSYHNALLDAENGLNELPNEYARTSDGTTTIVYARIYNRNNPECYATTSFDITVKKAPEATTTVPNWTVCDDDTDGFYDFDLSTKSTEILNNQDASVFSISYYRNPADADTRNNAIVGLFTNTNPTEDIFYRIENSAYNECYQTGSFIVEVILGVTANTIADSAVCDDNNDGISNFNLSLNDATVLGSQSSTSFTVSYHNSQGDADVGQNALNNTDYNNTTAYNETIYVRVANNASSGCYATTTFQLSINDSPVLQTVTNWQICDNDNDGITSFDFSEKDVEILGNQSNLDFTVSYYTSQTEADTNTNPIVGLWNNTIRTQEVFYRVQSNSNTACVVTSSFQVQVFNTPITSMVTNIVACNVNQTGQDSFDLSRKDTEVLGLQNSNEFNVRYFTSEANAIANQNPINKTSYTNQQTTETIYARISNSSLESCYAITYFQLILNSLPKIDLEETYVICPDSPNLEIDGGDFESYSWKNNQNIELSTERNFSVSSLGNYELTVTETNNGITCENTTNFEVVSSGAPETISFDTNGFSDKIQIVINAEGIGDFEYSIDGITYQNTNEFEVFPGNYTIYVRDPFECRTLSETIFVLGYQKFFTPNGDGTNDFWNIIGGNEYPDSVVSIYDRYGKLVKQIPLNSQGWDGMYNGQALPASDYWFSFTYDNGKTEKGHFSLKR
ncbi:T9SS type B sorting domain-containing protein [Cellulophaga sp. Hel_I_12]|uniref:T9SS type B sorting domain-containing protein n=1 Tax=Cellulophaga sp. Hel_I_12 TaxID=1249972 RepID=UPI00064738F1|nr:T9SS type B sorting domain-containing protein [Cellulophaga sp. Hel_I_12]